MKPGEPDDIPGVGLYCSILDSEGNRVGMLEPKGM
jgi:predicted enzyme related to lactoylglutathione lyase